jgi:hypothetical protein
MDKVRSESGLSQESNVTAENRGESPTRKKLSQFRAFQLLERAEKRIREETPFTKFKELVQESLEDTSTSTGVKLPDDSVLAAVYERAVDGMLARKHAKDLTRIKSTVAWQKHREWTADVEKQAEAFKKLLSRADDRLLPRAAQLEVQSSIARLAALESDILEARRFDLRLEQIASVPVKSSSLRDARRLMNRLFAAKTPDLSIGEKIRLICEPLQVNRA